MKALTIYQPWSSLVMIGAKPYEFRRWDYRTRERGLEGQRIVIHASARKLQPQEVEELLFELWADGGERSGLVHEPARKLLVEVGFKPGDGGVQLPLGCGLGTAVLGTPIRPCGADEGIFAWPLSDIRPFAAPVPMRGMQGFWQWPERMEAA